MTSDRDSSSRRTPNAVDIVSDGTRDARSNKTPMSDPLGADIGRLRPSDAVPGGPSNENGAIDGLPGRYERQDEEDVAAGLDM